MIPLDYEPPRHRKKRPNVAFQGLGAVLGTGMVMFGLLLLAISVPAIPEIFTSPRRDRWINVRGIGGFLMIGLVLVGFGARWVVKTMKAPWKRHDPDN